MKLHSTFTAAEFLSLKKLSLERNAVNTIWGRFVNQDNRIIRTHSGETIGKYTIKIMKTFNY